MWMETPNADNPKGYGKGQISVDPVSILDFNANPNAYLKDANGNFKYDVLFFGASDGYGSGDNTDDLTADSRLAVAAFTNTGRGLLLGHDTATRRFDHPQFSLLGDAYVNMIIDKDIPTIGDTRLTVKKKGLLTNYPWAIGDVGMQLNTPMSHSYGQLARGDVWMSYNGNSWVPGSGEGKDEISQWNGQTGTNNFYLTTWNNTAMIQTGHSTEVATPDEQKILANTLFYLSQLTQATSWDDHSGQDLAAPSMPTLMAARPSGGKISASAAGSTDTGSPYTYDVIATGQNNGTKIKSNSQTVTVTSGLASYGITVDQDINGAPTASSPKLASGQSTNLTVPSGNFYVHAAAFDGAGNRSSVRTQLIDVTAPTLAASGNPVSEVHASVPLVVTATDGETLASGVSRIKTPDGVWHAGSSVNYTATVNGTYAFVAEDAQGNQATLSVPVTKIGDKLWVKTPPATTVAAGSAQTGKPLGFSGPALSIEDNQESSGGWHVTVQATPPKTTTGHSLPAGSVQIAAPTLTGTGITAAVSGTTLIDGASPVTIARASGKASGTISLTKAAGMQINVPARSYAGTYSTVVTLTLVSGP